MTAADYPDWSIPQTSANAIAATGVPLLSSKTLLGSNTTAINAGTVFSTPVFSITQPSYELRIIPYESGAGATGPLQIVVSFIDSVSGQTVDYQRWWVWPGVTTADHVIYGSGPTRADQIVVTFNNTSAAMQYSVGWSVFQSSRLFSKDDLRTLAYNTTASGNVLPVLDPASTLLAYRSVTVLTGANDVTELPLYSGPAQLFADTSSSTTDFTLTVQDSAHPNAEGIGIRTMRFKSDTHGFIYQQLVLPRYQCRVNMNNANAGSQSLTYSLHTIEQ